MLIVLEIGFGRRCISRDFALHLAKQQWNPIFQGSRVSIHCLEVTFASGPLFSFRPKAAQRPPKGRPKVELGDGLY